MRGTSIARTRFRRIDNLADPGGGDRRPVTGWMSPYRLWQWKQNETFRYIFESQWEHLRRIYKRQWYEAFRVNADEYIYKYNKTKAAQWANWEREMEDQDKKRRDAMHMGEGRAQLKAKHLDLLQEYHERHFFHWYERASERLQYLAKQKFVSKENLEAHIERELNKYVAGSSDPYPLNFVGQIPFLEDEDGQVKEVPAHLAANYAAHHPSANAAVYDAPTSKYNPADGDAMRRSAAISGEILDILGPAAPMGTGAPTSGEASDSKVQVSVLEDMFAEAQATAKQDSGAELMTASEQSIAVAQYKNRGKMGSRRRDLRKGGVRQVVAASSRVPTGVAANPDQSPDIPRGPSQKPRGPKTGSVRRSTTPKGRELAETLKTSEPVAGPTVASIMEAKKSIVDERDKAARRKAGMTSNLVRPQAGWKRDGE